ncbi:hypothetical protein Drorol1_Dr00022259 [Drosera rotundifolia]
MALQKCTFDSKSSLHMPSTSILNKVQEHPHLKGRARVNGRAIAADIDVDLREVYFLMMHFLSIGPCQKTLSQFWNELTEHQLLPRRYHAWYSRKGTHSGNESDDGISFPLTYEDLLDRYSHVDKDHLVKLLKQLLLSVSNQLPGVSYGLNAADVPTLLGTGPFSLLGGDENEEKLNRRLPHYLRWPHLRINQVHGLHLRAIGGGFNRHHRAPSVHAACYAIAKPSTVIEKIQNIKKLRGHRSAVYCAVFDHMGRYVITGSDDRLVKIWSMETAFCLASCRGHEGDITDLAVSSNDVLVASASNDFAIRIWRLPDGLPISVLLGHTGTVTAIAFSPRAGAMFQLLSSSDDGTCRIWDARYSHVKPRIYVPRPVDPLIGKGSVPAPASTLPNQQIFCCSYNANGTVFVTGSSDSFARVWNAGKPFTETTDDSEQPNHEVDILSGHEDDVNYVQFSGCAAPSRSATFDCLKEDQSSKYKTLWFSHDNIVTCSRDGTAIIWIPRSRRSQGKAGRWMKAYHLKVPPPPSVPQRPRGGPRQRNLPTPRGVNMIVWSLDNRFVLAAIMDHRICVWNASDGSLVHSLTGHSESTYVLDVHPFNPRIAMSAGYDGKTIIWDIWEGTPVWVFEIGRFKLVDGKFSPDGTSILLSDDVGQIYILNTGQGEAQKDAKYDQFFLGDYRPLVRDALGNVVDQESQLTPYRRNCKDLLCDSGLIPYPEPYQTAYQRRRLGALGLEWQPSSVKFAIGPDFSSGEDYQMMPLADLDAVIDVPEFLDATYWEPEIEVISNDSDSEYDAAEEFSGEKEQESFGTSFYSDTESGSENIGFERQKDETWRSMKKRKKPEVEFTPSGRRVKKKSLEDCDGQSFQGMVSRKPGRKPSKKRSSNAESSRPQRAAARNALNMFSRIPEASSDEEEMDDSQSESIASETFSDLKYENGEPGRGRQTLYPSSGEGLCHESAEVTEPTELPALTGNVGEKRRLVLKFSIGNSKKSLVDGPSSSKTSNADQFLAPSVYPDKVKDSGSASTSADTPDLVPLQSTKRIRFKFKSGNNVELKSGSATEGLFPGASEECREPAKPNAYKDHELIGNRDQDVTVQRYPANYPDSGISDTGADEIVANGFMKSVLATSDEYYDCKMENSQFTTKIKIRSGLRISNHARPGSAPATDLIDLENFSNGSDDDQSYDDDDCYEPEADAVRRTRSMEMKASSAEHARVTHKLMLRKGNKLVGRSNHVDSSVDWTPSSSVNAKSRLTRISKEIYDNDELVSSTIQTSSTIRKTSWLMLSEHEPGYRYIPQLGDEVVYLRQGHQEYIESSSSHERGPWITMKGKLNAAELCIVQGLDYATVPGSGESCCKFTLKFINPSSDVFGKSFKLTLPELVNFPDFLVEKTRFDASVAQSWTPGNKCLVWWRDEGEEGGDWWEGQIVFSRPKSNDFPDSPWERHIVKYKRDPTDDHSHSPWELHCPDDNWEHPHIDFEIRKKLLSYFSKVEHSSRRNQDCYGIQKLQQVSQKSDFLNRFPVPLSPEIIQSRLEHNYYRNFEAVKHDIQVMISNALAYFSKNADACMKINRLADFFRRKLQLLV